MSGKISERAMRLLLIVDQGTERDWATGAISRFWLPGKRYSETRIERLGESVVVGGAGDAQALKALERRGLIERMSGSSCGPYAYAITEDGRLAIEKYLELKTACPRCHGGLGSERDGLCGPCAQEVYRG